MLSVSVWRSDLPTFLHAMLFLTCEILEQIACEESSLLIGPWCSVRVCVCVCVCVCALSVYVHVCTCVYVCYHKEFVDYLEPWEEVSEHCL